MNGAVVRSRSDAEVLTGHLAVYGELLGLLAERPGLLVVAGDPLSGTSALLATATGALEGRTYVRVDARGCADVLDLAMAIGDAAVGSLAPEAEAWWMGLAAPASTAGLRVSRAVSARGIDLQRLQDGSGKGIARLSDAVELLVALDGEALLIDHFGPMLSSMSEGEARELLGVLRSLRQRHPGFDLVLVEHTGGTVSSALADHGHPLFQAGQVFAVSRSLPSQFVADLAVARAWTDVPTEDLGVAAELAAGVPDLTWRTLELTRSGESPVAGWQRLRHANEVGTAQQWDLLRRAHPQAQAVVAAISVGIRPHSVSANSKSINEALTRLRGLGQAWQPQERTWSLASPLLRSWAREHAPSWARRFSRSA